jgi:hypothetical protein
MQKKRNLLNWITPVCGLFVVLAALMYPATTAYAAAGNTALKIYEVAGAGGIANAPYRQDTIILFNPTQAAITCASCAIQTHSGTSNTGAWTVYKLPALAIPAGGYYMISASAEGLSTIGADAPIAYDYELKTIEGTVTTTDNILSSTVGVVALTNSQTALTASAASQCGTGAQLLDLVGYGSNIATNAATTASPASCYAGTGEAYYDGSSALGRQLGITRSNRCTDTFDNSKDFVNIAVTYFNSGSAPTVCPTGSQLSAVVAATPSTAALGATVKFTAVVTNATSPNSSGVTAFLDANSPYFGAPAPLQMYDDGSHGDVTANDGTYTLSMAIPATVTPGFTYPVNVTVNDAHGNSFTGATPLTVSTPVILPSSGNNNLRIVAWYGAGNLSKSEYGRDTVLLFNPTQSPITMNNWSLQTGGATGTFSTVTYLLPVVTIPAGGYYALAGSGVDYISSAGCSSAHCNLNYAYDYQLKTIEETAPGGKNTLTVDNDLSSTAVTVALVNNQSALGTCPLTSANLIDLVGIGAADGSSPVTCYAGSGSASYTPATTNGAATNINGVVYAYATIRKNKCGNTFDNANDFMLGFIDFANSSTKPTPCPTGTQLAVSASASPNSEGILEPFTLTANVTPATTPTSASLNVTADLSNLGLSATSLLFDDGSHGDKTAGDHVFTLKTAATAGNIGAIPGLIVSATDAQGNKAENVFPLTIQAGTVLLTTPNVSATVTSGGVVTFPITITAQHGYGGILNITCTGAPNANSLGLPLSTQCVASPPEITVATDGTATLSLAVATGTTFSAGFGSSSWLVTMLGVMSIGLLSVAVWRRRRLPMAVMVALISLLVMNTTACGKNAGLGNTGAAAGTYTYTITATDSNVSTVLTSLNLTVVVQ